MTSPRLGALGGGAGLGVMFRWGRGEGPTGFPSFPLCIPGRVVCCLAFLAPPPIAATVLLGVFLGHGFLRPEFQLRGWGG